MPEAPLDALVAEHVTTLQIPDLDAGFRLKLATMIAACVPLTYEEFARRIDVAAVRRRGVVTVATYVEFTRPDGFLAVGAPLHTRSETVHSELSGRGAGTVGARMGFESRYTFRSPPGTGDPRRYRELAGPDPQPCGHGRMILTMIRPHARPADRLVAEPLPETGHLRPHPLHGPHPTVESLSAVPEEFAGKPHEDECCGVFGRHDTDINQYVFTGAYFSLLESHAALLLSGDGADAGRHLVGRVAVAFLRPFTAGARYVVRGTLQRAGDRTLALIGVHAVTPEGTSQHPAVFGRVDGRLPDGPDGEEASRDRG
jgi:Thioesterase superfamily